MNAHDAICKAAHDALCTLRVPHAHHVWVAPNLFIDHVGDAIEAALSAAGYTITLTDDGAAATPPADKGAANTPAAESATPVGAGDAAPSSPHPHNAATYSRVHHFMRGWDRGEVISASVTAGEGQALLTYSDLYALLDAFKGEGATPAIDREALTELLRRNRHAPYVSNERLADMVAALIEGAS